MDYFPEIVHVARVLRVTRSWCGRAEGGGVAPLERGKIQHKVKLSEQRHPSQHKTIYKSKIEENRTVLDVLKSVEKS